jgi:peptide/nickel transport system permease protein
MRIFQSLVALLLFSMVVFGLVRLGGDPALRFMSSDSTEEEYKYFRSQLGLDEPIYVQYGIFLTDVVRGDFGTSIFTKRRVIDSIKEMLPNSLRLIAASASIAFIIAVPLGVMAAVRKKTLVDTLARVIAGLGQSFPSFWIGLMMIQVFAVKLGVLPTSGMGSWKHYVMPASCLALFLIPGPIRLLRSSMLESLDSEYIRLARIKGVSERLTIWKHAFRNSLLPVLSFSAMYIAILVTGCIVIETVFAWSGMGRLCYRAIISQDFPLIQGVVMTTAVIVIAANLIVDILYGYLDPRIRLKV